LALEIEHTHMKLFRRRSFTVVLWMVMAHIFYTSADEKDRQRWDARYEGEEFIFGKQPVAFLKEIVHLLPKGRALDIAMGEGRNGVFLATRGFDVLGLDISEKGLRKAHELARDSNTTIATKVVNLEKASLPADEFEVVVMTYYLQRDLFPQIKKALKPGGMVVIETYNKDHARYRPEFPKEYLLEKKELPEVFKDFEILEHQDLDDGKSAYTSFLARKKGGS
jgi:tellurite methyltransferase